MKKITFILTATFFLGLFQSQPANAEVCSTGTYTVGGINTFANLPCSDPGTEINVTVRGLHDYGVSGGPTAYCSFIYIRKNLGTVSSPNWSGSTNTVCDPRPTPVVVATPTPEPTPTPTPTPVVVEQTIANPGECSIANPCHTYAVLDNARVVTNVIVCQPSFCGNGTLPDGTRVVPQVAANSQGQNQGSVFNPIGSGKDVVYQSNGTFTVNNEVVVNKVDVVTNTTNTETSTVTATISSGNASTFSYEDTIGKSPSEISFTTLPLANNTSATIGATDVTSNSTRTESTVLEGRKTALEVSSILVQRNLSLLQSKIDRLLILLGSWLL